MKILPINDDKMPNKNFKAKLSAKDVNGLLREINGKDASYVPKLYTLLERLDELPGKKAGFDEEYNWCSLTINENDVNPNKFFSKFSALYSSLVEHKDTNVKNSSIIRMPERIFEQKWWDNRGKTKTDIKQFGEKRTKVNVMI